MTGGGGRQVLAGSGGACAEALDGRRRPVYAADVILLFQPPSVWGMPCVSPFGTKVETYLRMAGLAYETRSGDPRRAPKGKIPWIEDAGQRVFDSSDIVDHLKAKYGDPLDGALRPEQRAEALLARRTIEEHLYWCLAYARWIDADGYRHMRGYFQALVPKVIGGLIIDHVIRKKIAAALHAQGVGRHEAADIYRRGGEDLTALSLRLGTQSYYFGEQPSSIDASVYAFTISLWRFPADNPLKRHMATLANLVAYTERMHGRYFAPTQPPGRSDGA